MYIFIFPVKNNIYFILQRISCAEFSNNNVTDFETAKNTYNFSENSQNEEVNNVSSAEGVDNNTIHEINIPLDIKNKIFHFQANLDLSLTKKIGTGKYLVSNIREMLQNNILRPIKDTIEKINIELSPEYNNNNYGAFYQSNTRPFLQKLNEKKHELFTKLGIGCCNYNYPFPY